MNSWDMEVDIMEMILTKEVEGLTVGRIYETLPVGGENLLLVDDNGENVIVYESYFEDI